MPIAGLAAGSCFKGSPTQTERDSESSGDLWLVKTPAEVSGQRLVLRVADLRRTFFQSFFRRREIWIERQRLAKGVNSALVLIK